MKTFLALLAAAALLAGRPHGSEPFDLATWTNRPLTLSEAVEIALESNGAIRQAKSDLEAEHGISMQARSIALPQLKAGGAYTYYQLNEQDPFFPGLNEPPNRRWFGSVRLVQSIYEGGRLRSSLKTARLTREQAAAKYRAVVADTLLEVRTAYFDVQLSEARERVLRSTTELLDKQAEDAKRRFEAGLLQKLDVLRAEVAAANSRPKLLRARNQTRLAKTRLAQLLGRSVPPEAWEKMPFSSAERFAAQPIEIELAGAITQSLQNRPEIEAQSKLISILRERLRDARGGYKPSVQAFTGYGGLNDDLNRDLYGWFAGVQLNWDLFDGLKTRGKIKQAEAELKKAEQAAEDLTRQVELQVRTAYSSLSDAREILESQRRAREQAEEALRVANSRFAAGEITQLEVLAAEAALAEVRSTAAEAIRDYNVALAQLERSMGLAAKSE